MSTETVRYVLELGGLRLAAREVSGREALSTPFRFEVKLHVNRDDCVPSRLVRTAAALSLEDDRGERRRIDGIVTDISLGAAVRGSPELCLVIEPRLALARHRSNMRIFRDRSVPEIVTQVLAGIGVKPELRLSESYAPRPYCVQLRETDFDFVSRLLEDEGIGYFFLEGDTLVLCDSAAGYEPMPGGQTLQFRHGAGLDKAREVVFELGERASRTAGKVSLRDWNPEHPSLNMDVASAVGAPTAVASIEQYDYPGVYALPAEGARKARLRAEALAVASSATVGRSMCPRLLPGVTFDLLETPPGQEGGALVVTRLDHAWRSDETSFSNRFDAADAAVTYRPLAITPSPCVTNPMTGLVTGPPGADIHTDELGRVKVHLHWDRLQPFDDHCSDWIPVLQDNTGHSCGIPRIGWEVLVAYLEGNPDRPVVLGRVYNGADPFPESLPAGKTFSALRSLSSPGRDGSNIVRTNDAGGMEEVYVQAERDQNMVTANDKRTDVGAEEQRVVGGDETITIGNDDKALVGGNMSVSIGGNMTWTVGSDRDVSVGGADSSTVTSDHSLSIGGQHFRRIATDDKVNTEHLKEQVGAVILEASVKDNATSAKAAMALTVGGALVEVAKKDRGGSTKGVRVETIGGALFSKSGETTSAAAKKARVLTVGGALVVTATGALKIGGTTAVSAKVAGAGTFAGAKTLTLKVGESTEVSLGGGVVLIKAKSVLIDASGSSEVGVGEAALV